MSGFFIGTAWNQSSLSLHYRALAHEMARRGHRVTVLVPNQKRHLVNPSSNPAVFTWPSKRPTNLADALFLARLIRQRRPDCLIANFGASNVMMLVGWLLRVPVRIDWYHTLSEQIEYDRPRSPWKARYLRQRKQLVYAMATYLVANSHAAARDIQRVYGLSDTKCSVKPYSLADPELQDCIDTLYAPQGGSVVCVGRLHPSKGQATLIRAAQELSGKHPGLRVTFVGDGPSRAEYETLAESLGIRALCAFEGLQPQAQVFGYMRQSAFTVVPSLSEAFGMVAVESLAVGTPVIASNVGGLAEIIRDGLDGYLVPPGDPVALAERMAILLENPEQRRQMGRNARERFLTTFERGRVIAELADWLEHTVSYSSD